jgi:hypothetical protein
LSLWGAQWKLYGANSAIGDGNSHWEFEWCFDPGTNWWAIPGEYVRDDAELLIIIYEAAAERSNRFRSLRFPRIILKGAT